MMSDRTGRCAEDGDRVTDKLAEAVAASLRKVFGVREIDRDTVQYWRPEKSWLELASVEPLAAAMAEVIREAFQPVTPESLEAHADWLDKRVPDGRCTAEEVRAQAALLRPEAEKESAVEAARRKVLQDLKPGLYELTATGSGDRTLVVLTADGTLFGRQPEGANFGSYLPDITELYGKMGKYWSFRALALGSLSPVVADGE